MPLDFSEVYYLFVVGQTPSYQEITLVIDCCALSSSTLLYRSLKAMEPDDMPIEGKNGDHYFLVVIGVTNNSIYRVCEAIVPCHSSSGTKDLFVR